MKTTGLTITQAINMYTALKADSFQWGDAYARRIEIGKVDGKTPVDNYIAVNIGLSPNWKVNLH